MPDSAPPTEAGPVEPSTAEYGSYYYRHDCGSPYERSEHWLKFFDKVAEGIVNDLHPSSFLDAGCAMGFLVEEMQKRGVDSWGIDISKFAISKVDESVANRCRVGSLTEPLDRRYDLIACIEVLEHIPPEEIGTVIGNLCAASDQILLSTSPTDYGEATHLNVQPPETWAAALAREGFLRDLDRDFPYLTPWASLYTRQEEPLAETVRRYDRAWSRRRQEATEVRAALLKAQTQLAELERSEEGLQPRSKLQAEVDRLREENLRLRDLLIGKDAELGVTRGQLAIHQDQSQRMLNAVGRVQSRIPGFMRVGGIALRWIQGRRG